MKKLSLPLLPRILLAIVLGIVLAGIMPEWLSRVFVTFNAFFSQFLGFAIPLIILALVSVAIADIGRGAGKLLLLTTVIAYGSTVVAGVISYATGEAFFPRLIDAGHPLTASVADAALTPYFVIDIPPTMSVMSALVLAFILGLGMAYLTSDALKNTMRDFQHIVTQTITSVIIPLLPLYIFGIFLSMAQNGQVWGVLNVFVSIIVVIFVLHVCWLVAQFSVAGLVTRSNPFRILGRMMPAYFTALGTQSSAATIPVTLAQTIKNGVSPQVAGFVVPLCATIHLSGSMLKIVACALALMMMQGMPHTTGLFIGFILMLAITMVAAPGVPGGAIMAALGVLHSMLGFDDAMQALIIALYIAMDSFGTACNVTGDGAIALVVERIKKGWGRS